ncbi:Uncharacterized protein DBV15_10043 [Temnothorax longispinosus]|uniref:Uncharacterized protein n=1 Tax=Temnothorax longispinosus TaxID=300112 RepID=A0A4S2JPG6_9HYME|nr:Uncharacterized protein DBV15_10043 [Temnothorax longispinosus]
MSSSSPSLSSFLRKSAPTNVHHLRRPRREAPRRLRHAVSTVTAPLPPATAPPPLPPGHHRHHSHHRPPPLLYGSTPDTRILTRCPVVLAERNAALVAPGANVRGFASEPPRLFFLSFPLSPFHPLSISVDICLSLSLSLLFLTLLSIVHARARSLARGKKRRRRHQRRSASSLLKCETAKPPAAKQRDTLSRGFPLLVSSSRVALSLRLSPSVRSYVRTSVPR